MTAPALFRFDPDGDLDVQDTALRTYAEEVGWVPPGRDWIWDGFWYEALPWALRQRPGPCHFPHITNYEPWKLGNRVTRVGIPPGSCGLDQDRIVLDFYREWTGLYVTCPHLHWQDREGTNWDRARVFAWWVDGAWQVLPNWRGQHPTPADAPYPEDLRR